jgi:L-lactate dehydrogenase complex protein LldG
MESGLRARSERRSRPPQPVFDEESVVRFTRKFEAVHGTVIEVGELNAVPSAIHQYISENALKPQLAVSEGDEVFDRWDQLDWPEALSVARGVVTSTDQLTVTPAFAGIAETGTLVLLSNPGAPAKMNYLPEHHLVVLSRARMVKFQEDAWDLIRRRQAPFPRAVCLITGPSKTADVEQTIQYGAHGPRAIHVLLVD